MEVEQLGDGFLVPPLIRFVNGEDAYISMTNGGPHAFFNIEDHLSKSTGVENTKFQVGGLIPETCGPCPWLPNPLQMRMAVLRLLGASISISRLIPSCASACSWHLPVTWLLSRGAS